MDKLFHFQKLDNTSELDLQLIVASPSYSDIYSIKDCHYGLVKAVLLRENSLIIYILNDIYTYTLTISKKSTEYQKYVDLFNKNHFNNNKLSKLKARIELDIIDNSTNDEFDNVIFGDGNEYNISYVLKGLDLQVFNSNIDIKGEIKEFLFEHYNYFLDMSLRFYELDYSLRNLLKEYPFYELLDEISAMTNYDEFAKPCFVKSSKPFKLLEWKEKLKNKVLIAETWLAQQKEESNDNEFKESEESINENDNSENESYEPEIEQEDVTLESVGYTYDEDSEVYSLYDGPINNSETNNEDSGNYLIELVKREREIEQYAEDRQLLKYSYFFSETFSKSNWKDGLASIIDNEVVYSLIMHMKHREQEELFDNSENEENYQDDW